MQNNQKGSTVNRAAVIKLAEPSEAPHHQRQQSPEGWLRCWEGQPEWLWTDVSTFSSMSPNCSDCHLCVYYIHCHLTLYPHPETKSEKLASRVGQLKGQSTGTQLASSENCRLLPAVNRPAAFLHTLKAIPLMFSGSCPQCQGQGDIP